MRSLPTILVLYLLLSTPPASANDSWEGYIDGRVNSGVYYLVNESLEKLHTQNPNLATVKNKRAFEFGSGSGNEAIFLLKRGRGLNCIDSSSRSHQIISQRAEEYGESFRFNLSSFSEAPLSGKYHFVYSINALPFEKRSSMLGLFKRIQDHLSPNGVFAFTFNGPKCGSTFGYTRKEIHSLLSESGFKVEYFS
ncbi:Uncharacterised protein [BD1-7 clade bacterium]|uniref:Methyltransferase domain-containing protein n=1 Tax=BD1-7 clade bacterium TaxID=2029982 RepID=A0A5S9Q662_9GAMM|nr:Uncharacterised protein [BD1-7 clade bacterium]CAA0113362.1 Uncharacterised protein [BD1-7 clade bacterium]